MYDVVIIGSGPAGYTAGIYSTRSGLKTLILEGEDYGGQLMNTTDVDNFPGFPNGINGPDLMINIRQQCVNLGCEILSQTVISVDLSNRSEFRIFTAIERYVSKSVIIATGATAKKLDLPSGDTFWNHGISACAVCDGALPMFRNKTLVVVGGGDTACEEALFLSRFGSKIYMVVRSGKMRASYRMKQEVEKNEKIVVVYNTTVVDVSGIVTEELTRINSVKLFDKTIDEEIEISIGGMFYAIGHIPNTSFLNGALKVNDAGYIISDNTKTEIPGVFACGDVQDYIYRQAITAAGSGCMAALEAERYLMSQ